MLTDWFEDWTFDSLDVPSCRVECADVIDKFCYVFVFVWMVVVLVGGVIDLSVVPDSFLFGAVGNLEGELDTSFTFEGWCNDMSHWRGHGCRKNYFEDGEWTVWDTTECGWTSGSFECEMS